MMGKTEVSLTLTNKFDVPGEANAETDAKTLLLKYILIRISLFCIKTYSPLFRSLKTFAFQHQEAYRGRDPIPTGRNAIGNPGHCSNHRAGKQQKGSLRLCYAVAYIR